MNVTPGSTLTPSKTKKAEKAERSASDMIHEAWVQPPTAASTARSWCDDGTSALGSGRGPVDDEAEDEDEEALMEALPALEEEDAPMPPTEEVEPVVSAAPPKVVQSSCVELLPSIFPHRPPTVFFELAAGMPPRTEAVAARGGASQGDEDQGDTRVRVTLDATTSRALCMRIEKNANSVRHAFKRAGFVVNPGHSAPALVCWAKHSGEKLWKELPPGGLVNHFPGSWTLGRKDGLAKILADQQKRLGCSEYNFFPRTFTLPADRNSLEHALSHGQLQGDGAFIVKPLNSSRGRGIHLCNDVDELEPDAKVLVQEYIARPLLLQERKFDLRIYVLVTSFEPLRAYTYEQGLGRFATQPYTPPSADDVGDRSAHLTNYSINKHDGNYIANTDASEDATGHKWSLAAVYRALSQHGVDVPALRKRIDLLLAKTLIAAQPHVCQKYGQHFTRRNACFELFGFDVMLDADARPWLIEVNVSPDLASTSPLDRQLKGNLASDTVHLVGVKPPQSVCAAGRCVAPPPPRPDEPPILGRQFHNGRHQSELANVPFAQLGPHELTMLVETEEEWARASQTAFRRIYPPPAESSLNKLNKCFEVPRFADQLTAAYARRPNRLGELRQAIASLRARDINAFGASPRAPSAAPPPAAALPPAAYPIPPPPPLPQGHTFPPAAAAAIRDAAIAAATAAAAATRAGVPVPSASFARPLTASAHHVGLPPSRAHLSAVPAVGVKLPRRQSSSSRSASRGQRQRHGSPKSATTVKVRASSARSAMKAHHAGRSSSPLGARGAAAGRLLHANAIGGAHGSGLVDATAAMRRRSAGTPSSNGRQPGRAGTPPRTAASAAAGPPPQPDGRRPATAAAALMATGAALTLPVDAPAWGRRNANKRTST